MSSKHQGKNKGSDSKASGSDQSPIGIKVVWDHDNDVLPPEYKLGTLKENSNLALKGYNPRYEVTEFFAFGPKKPPGIESYDIKYIKFKRENVECEGNPKAKECFQYMVIDPKNKEAKTKRNIEVADVQIQIKMITEILKGTEYVLLIAGGNDYLGIMQKFPLTKFLLAVNDECDKRLFNRQLAVWRWITSSRSTPMIFVGGPIVVNRAAGVMCA